MLVRVAVFVLCICTLSLCASVDDQRKGLQDLYEATNGKEWTKNKNWLQTEDYCSWHGVLCFTGTKTVYGLDLKFNNLQGTLPSSISLLESLQMLSISSNQIYGSIPESIGQLVNMSSLHLTDNQFTGTLPASLGQLSILIIGYFGGNQLSGTIPESFGNFRMLYGLDLSNNQLSGIVPASFVQLTGLVELQLGYNQLTGVDPSLPLFPDITRCNLRRNPLSCDAPKWVFTTCLGQCVTVTPPVQSPIGVEPVQEPVNHVPVTQSPVVESPVSAPSTNVPQSSPISSPSNNVPVSSPFITPTINVTPPVTSDNSTERLIQVLVLALTSGTVVLVTVLMVLVVRTKRREADPERKQLLGDDLRQGLLVNQNPID